MSNHTNITNCVNCNQTHNKNYCSNCGQAKTLKRIDKDYIFNEVRSVLNFDKGFFYTIKALLLRPGKTVRAFIKEDRNRIVKPIIFIIITSLIYTVLRQIFQFEDGYVNFSNVKDSATTTLLKWIQNNYGYANILMGIFIALWAKVLFKKYAFNFYEILILLCFIMGIGMLLFSVFGVFERLTNLKVLQIAGIIAFVYNTWAIAQFFDRKKIINYFKAVLAYTFGMLTFMLGMLSIGFLIDYFF